jgi:uncharacterized protein
VGSNPTLSANIAVYCCAVEFCAAPSEEKVAISVNTSLLPGWSLVVTFLAPIFFTIALLYASVGFGGGSSYNAILALVGVDFRVMPAIALCCNIIVVTGGSLRFHRAGLVPWRRVLPIVLVSAPLAWAGGLTPIKQPMFMALLAVSLAFAGIALLIQREMKDESFVFGKDRFYQNMLIGSAVGYLSGLVGLGGGIFLAPYLHMTRWAKTKQVAATASVFILINSIAGLIGQMMKLNNAQALPQLIAYWPLALSVLIGGQIGSMIGIQMLAPRLVRRLTAVLILTVAAQTAWKLLSK